MREANAGPVAKLAKRHGVSDATIYAWRKRFGELESADNRVASEIEAKILEMALQTPTYGSQRTADELRLRGVAAPQIETR